MGLKKYMFGRLGVKTKIRNLGHYCHTTEKGVHCPQYIFDAEYCSIFSAYFLYLFTLAGAPHDEESIKKIVTMTFIHNPEKVRRDICKESNEFRLYIISFLLSVMIPFTNSLQFLKKIENDLKSFEKNPGYRLVSPFFFDLLSIRIKELEPAAASNAEKGGGRHTKRRRRLRTSAKKHAVRNTFTRRR
jgi:hypothetical protein